MMSPFEHGFIEPLVSSTDAGGVRISATARLAEIAADERVRSSYPLLAATCERDQAMGHADATLADSLAPATGCVRVSDGVMCALNGSATCAARDPGSDLHSVIDGGPCWRATLSSASVALVALEGELEISTLEGSQWRSAEQLFASAGGALSAEPRAYAIVLAARLSSAAAGGYQRFARIEGDGAESGICLAAVRRADGDVRLVLGGVSPRPYRVYTSVEEEAMAGGLDEEAIAGLADRALLDAEGDPRSTARVDAAAGLLRVVIQEIASS